MQECIIRANTVHRLDIVNARAEMMQFFFKSGSGAESNKEKRLSNWFKNNVIHFINCISFYVFSSINQQTNSMVY